jgi:hypothetical protein
MGAAGIVLDTGGSPPDRARRAGIVVIVAVATSYGIFAVVNATTSRWSLAFWAAISAVLYAGGNIGRARYRSESITLARAREREVGKSEAQRISESIKRSPIASKLATERWLGETVNNPIFDAVARLPGVRFIQMGEEADEFDTAVDSQLRKPRYVAVCGRLVVAVYYARWRPGVYRRSAGPTRDLRRNGRIYESGRKELAQITESVRALRARIGGTEIFGLVIVTPQVAEVAPPSKPNAHDSAAEVMNVTDDNADGADVVITTEERAADLAGPFLAGDPYAIDLDVVAQLLEYATSGARADAGLSRYGTRRLTR